MAYVVWKFVRGKGPYAYLRRSERVDGLVRARELGYLGRWSADGSGTVRPGDVVPGPAGEEVVVPEFSPSVLRRLPTTPEGRLPTTAGPEPGDAGGGLPTTSSAAPPTVPEGESNGLPTTDPGELPTTAGPDAGGDGDGLPTTPARPHRLGDGSWGVVSDLRLTVGDVVEVRTARGQTWRATVTEVLEPTGRGFVARTSGRPGR